VSKKNFIDFILLKKNQFILKLIKLIILLNEAGSVNGEAYLEVMGK
jgi:hypothetical protein